MRPLNLIAYDVLNSRWTTVDSVDFKHRMLHDFGSEFKGNPTYIVDFKLVASTEVLDMDGNMIYEGDILEIEYNKETIKRETVILKSGAYVLKSNNYHLSYVVHKAKIVDHILGKRPIFGKD